MQHIFLWMNLVFRKILTTAIKEDSRRNMINVISLIQKLSSHKMKMCFNLHFFLFRLGCGLGNINVLDIGFLLSVSSTHMHIGFFLSALSLSLSLLPQLNSHSWRNADKNTSFFVGGRFFLRVFHCIDCLN